MTLRYFLFGKGPRCVKRVISGVPLHFVRFDYDCSGQYLFNGITTDYKYLLRHFLHDQIEYCGIGPKGEIRITIFCL